MNNENGEKLILDRRRVFASASTLVAAASIAFPRASAAQTPSPDFASSYFYRFSVGDLPATMVSDGPLPVGAPFPHFTKNISPEEVAAILDANFLRKDKMVLEQNILVLKTAGKTVLFDTGMGSLTAFGPSCGKLMQTLKAAGIDPSSIDAVVLSHAHIDHVSGIMKDDGSRSFPNAQYYINEVDYNFWTDPSRESDPRTKPARVNLIPNRDRIIFIKDNQEFLPGITAVFAPGHTVGHMMFMIQSGKERLCFTADLAHHSTIMLERPLVEFRADTDSAQSAQTRLKHLSILADDKTPVFGFHFPWPGIGYIVRAGSGFRFIPKPMENILVL